MILLSIVQLEAGEPRKGILKSALKDGYYLVVSDESKPVVTDLSASIDADTTTIYRVFTVTTNYEVALPDSLAIRCKLELYGKDGKAVKLKRGVRIGSEFDQIKNSPRPRAIAELTQYDSNEFVMGGGMTFGKLTDIFNIRDPGEYIMKCYIIIFVREAPGKGFTKEILFGPMSINVIKNPY